MRVPRFLYRLYLWLRWPVALRKCLTGKCWCRGAEDCFFARCKNCDGCVNAHGVALDDTWAEEWNRCPHCGGRVRP